MHGMWASCAFGVGLQVRDFESLGVVNADLTKPAQAPRRGRQCILKCMQWAWSRLPPP